MKDYVDLEVAKQLNKMGFIAEVHDAVLVIKEFKYTRFRNDSVFKVVPGQIVFNIDICDPIDMKDLDGYILDIPTITDVQTWLRYRGIDVLVYLNDHDFNHSYQVHVYKFGELKHIGPNIYFKTYEEALEYGIKQSLKL